ncbi:MAG: hypothetical protein AAFQ82_05310, partial [Myxococcota bacterium]
SVQSVYGTIRLVGQDDDLQTMLDNTPHRVEGIAYRDGRDLRIAAAGRNFEIDANDEFSAQFLYGFSNAIPDGGAIHVAIEGTPRGPGYLDFHTWDSDSVRPAPENWPSLIAAQAGIDAALGQPPVKGQRPRLAVDNTKQS